MARQAPTVDVERLLDGLFFSDSDEAVDADPVLAAAAVLIDRHGLGGWTMDDVADAAMVGRATLYRRYASRESLVRAALIRQTRLFFAAVTAAVESRPDLESKVVEGLLVSVRLLGESALPSLMDRHPGAALSLLRSEVLLKAATAALVERYSIVIGERPTPQVEAAAEALVRLGLSLVLVPGRGDRRHLRALVAPLLLPPPEG